MKINFVFLISLSIFFSNDSFSHHSNAPHYDRDKPISIIGIVEEFDFVNPHSFLYIRSDLNGESVVWECEMQTANTLIKQGWTANQFEVGQQVIVNAIAARRDPLGCSFTNAEMPDGSIINRSGSIETPEEIAFNYDREILINNKPNFKGPWKRDLANRGMGLGPGSQRPQVDRLTDKGLIAAESYDERFDDPSFQCSASSISRVWSEPGTVTDIIQTEEFIHIIHEYMDTTRVVILTEDHQPSYIDRPYGHSIGWYEGNTLVIDTIGFEGGVLTPHPGVMHSNQLHVIERLHLNDDGMSFVVSWVAEDPLYFKTPFEGTRHFIPSAYDIEPYGCIPEIAKR